MQNDESYHFSWEKVSLIANFLQVDELQLPRRRKRPNRYEEGIWNVIFRAIQKIYFSSNTLKLLI